MGISVRDFARREGCGDALAGSIALPIETAEFGARHRCGKSRSPLLFFAQGRSLIRMRSAGRVSRAMCCARPERCGGGSCISSPVTSFA